MAYCLLHYIHNHNRGAFVNLDYQYLHAGTQVAVFQNINQNQLYILPIPL
nr:MAG TPA_asm: hypothetical protein [Bacteriophage sp.]